MELNESDQDIERLVKHLETKIIELKRKNPNHEIIKLTISIFSKDIASWYESHKLDNKLTDKMTETKLKDKILDLINILNKL